ncbi:SMAD/FHA domain-containing protein [Pholiota conissans]|uniref:SMAD/FHA domain-containing protein n=1 Tax=Pholiota conissans TaxID=109636 RepID=A0A9P5ZFS8_9AGAR|nr:SMAD/FHA domain-containing protein [Pholiota conissans]
MSRRSRSPRRRAPEGNSSPRQSGYSKRDKPSRWNDEPYRDSRHSSSRDGDYGRSQRDDDRRPPRDSRDYDERRRERERERDRGRYDSGRERDIGNASSRSHRRSASPPARGSRGREVGSQSPSQDVSAEDKSKPNFAPSGLLAAETNTVKAVDGSSTVLKYNEPPEARKPIVGWRLYVFKDAEQLELLHIHRQSAYLVGRDRLVADIALEHPSCSKQHAVFQYRYIQEKDEFGSSKGVVKPFIIDLESTNGTIVNDETIPAARFYELKAGDVIKFGLSTREYVLLHDEAS